MSTSYYSPNCAGLCSTPGNPDSISKISWTKGSSNFIAASNWDGYVRVYQQQTVGSFTHVAAASTHNTAPIFCVDWHSDDASFFTCGGDNTAAQCSLAGGAITPTRVASHDAAIKTLTWWAEANLLVTGGFDSKMLYWDLRQPRPAFAMQCPGKVQCVASRGPTMVMTCLNHTTGDPTCKSAVYAFDKGSPSDNIRRVCAESQRAHMTKDWHASVAPTHRSPECLSYQIRCIGMMRGGAGWALGASEGRCVVENRPDFPVPPEWPLLPALFKDVVPKVSGPFQNPMSANFNFKCHRTEEKRGGTTHVTAFPCNGVSFNNRFNTMATCGGDGTHVFWDKDNRQKLKGFPAVGNSIIDIEFSPDSNHVAFAIAYDWAKGLDGRTNANEGLVVRWIPDAEIAPKSK